MFSNLEYIFAAALVENTVVFGGTNMILEQIDLETNKLILAMPVLSDVWSLSYHDGKLFAGHASGKISITDMKQPYRFNNIIEFSAQKFTGSANDYLPLDTIKKKYSFASMIELK